MVFLNGHGDIGQGITVRIDDFAVELEADTGRWLGLCSKGSSSAADFDRGAAGASTTIPGGGVSEKRKTPFSSTHR
jgi:hypothetical protein